ncbi:hypothetical protein DY000_02015375 [Brassica cretica]|uniref:Uncharacterized protein n=1 Tax=Brassica cretica TaxID=69181 RepID=A0ABQ7CUL2_BRACR|nr:hypothetical protein DY000_02015375 [Brassica cretica]
MLGSKTVTTKLTSKILEEAKRRKLLRQILFRNRFFFTKNLCGKNAIHRTRAREGLLRSDQTRAPLGRYVATEFEPKLSRYIATELFRNIDKTSVHAFSSTLRWYLPNTVANPSHVPRHF